MELRPTNPAGTLDQSGAMLTEITRSTARTLVPLRTAEWCARYSCNGVAVVAAVSFEEPWMAPEIVALPPTFAEGSASRQFANARVFRRRGRFDFAPVGGELDFDVRSKHAVEREAAAGTTAAAAAAAVEAEAEAASASGSGQIHPGVIHPGVHLDVARCGVGDQVLAVWAGNNKRYWATLAGGVARCAVLARALAQARSKHRVRVFT